MLLLFWYTEHITVVDMLHYRYRSVFSSFHGLGSWTGEPHSQALSVFRVGLHWLAAKELKQSYHNVNLQ